MREWRQWTGCGRAVAAAIAAMVMTIGALQAQGTSGSLPLTAGWQAHAVSAPEHPEVLKPFAATVPGVVQSDLARAGLIPDPFFGDNEKRLQWIEYTDWVYEDTFDVPAAALRGAHRVLVFEGLDTFADVSLNGVALASTDNMYRSWRMDVGSALHAGRNTLRIVFHSSTNKLTPYVAAQPYVLPGTGYEPMDRAKNIFPVSQYMRKAGYGYGWDWGPRFVTAGIWRPVQLEWWSGARVAALHVHEDAVSAARATGEAQVSVDADAAGAAEVRLHMTAPDGTAMPVRTLPVMLDAGTNLLRVPFRVERPALWYPNGYGAQSRYDVRVEVVRAGRVLAQAQTRTGFRSVELRRVADPWGTSFTFVINGIPIFAKGANFVPMDSFAPNITDARRRAVLTAARDAHMNMLRVWGGGYYETDSFYDLCDELGLMVWHDFMFGGGMVPGDTAFQNNVQAEAREQVSRLSDHPSMTLWCGNNEEEVGYHEWGGPIAFQQSLTPAQRERVWQDYVVMFRDILKSTVTQYGNGVPYWPSSPSSNFDVVPAGQQDGDMHSWRVWSQGVPYTEYAKDHPRFLSEFGFQSMPDLRTVRAFAGSDEDLHSPALENHERFIGGYKRMEDYLAAEFKPAKDFASFVYLSQVMQAQAIQFGVETMRSRRPETMGTLYWQLDDCWPVASWSSIDYFGRWKGLQYAAGRFYAPLLVTGTEAAGALTVHVVSDEQVARAAVVHLRLIRFDGTIVSEQRQPVAVQALASTALAPMQLPAFDRTSTVALLTLEQNGEVLASNTMYFAVAKEQKLPPVSIASSLRVDGAGYALELRSPVLARSVQIAFGDVDAKPADSFFDLLPNEPRTVHVASAASLAELRRTLTLRSVVDAERP